LPAEADAKAGGGPPPVADSRKKNTPNPKNVPKREALQKRTKTQYVVVPFQEPHQWLHKFCFAVPPNRRKTGVNTAIFG
jgi:hypothetical protein